MRLGITQHVLVWDENGVRNNNKVIGTASRSRVLCPGIILVFARTIDNGSERIWSCWKARRVLVDTLHTLGITQARHSRDFDVWERR
jgi:hypothetical protein